MDRKIIEVEEEELKTQAPDFWQNPKEAESFLKIIREKKKWIESYNAVAAERDDLEVIYEFYLNQEAEETDLDLQYQKVINLTEDLEMLNMLQSESDRLGAILQINPGAGGTESQDWAQMLMRMYMRYGERQNFKVSIVDQQDGDVAGIKSVSIEFEGENAYGFLKAENGVHRLVRLSPFDSANRRHTSFASVYVYPVVDDNIVIDINPAHISWDTFRSSGPGGQHVNKTESAVRLKHEPSGIVIECQETRSQFQNRDKALRMLKSQLYELELRRKMADQQAIEDSKLKIEWGSQIRSYVMHPYKLVKDLRTSFETSNVQAVMDGDIHDFIKSFLMFSSKTKPQGL